MIGILLIICLVLYFYTHVYEGYSDASNFIQQEANNLNPVGLLLTSAGAQGMLGSSTDALTGTPGTRQSTYTLNPEPSGLFKTIAKCEAIKTADCSAFDDSTFGTDCGICLDIGTTTNPATDSKKVPGVGGRVVLANNRKYPESNAKNGILPAYAATVGTCPANRLVTTKAQCLTLQRNLTCEKNGNFGLPGCVQCFSNSSYSIVDPKINPGVINGSGTLYLAGEGKVYVTYENQTPNQDTSITLSSSSQAIQLSGNSMTLFGIGLVGRNSKVSGYLSGTTASGKFTIDLHRIILVDQVTKAKPRTDGRTTLDGIDVTIMAPAFGKEGMELLGYSPFLFVEPTSQEAMRCPSSPFVSTEAAAEFLDSDPCYKKGSGPGKYTMECLQNSFLSNGCTQGGKAYPSDAVTSGNLMTKADGTPRSLSEISNYIYSQAMITATGLLNGQEVTLADWSAASVFCTGNTVDSPCDTQTKDTGPLSAKCLASLWKNQGTTKRGIGATYNVWSQATSLFSNTTDRSPTFCTTSGLMSPVLPNGQPNTGPAAMADGGSVPNVLAWWQQRGGVNAVKNIMKDWHEIANNKGHLDDTRRETFMSICYGNIKLAPELPPPRSGCLYPSGTDSGGLCSSVPPFSPVANRKVGTVNIISGDYTISFTVKPLGIVRSGWGNFMHVTNGGDCCGFGNRSPGIWFWPGTTELLIRLGDTKDGNWGLDRSIPCPVNVETPVSIVASGSTVTIKVGSSVYNLKQPTKRATGNGYSVYMSDPWYPAMNAVISRFIYTVDGVNFIPTLNLKV